MFTDAPLLSPLEYPWGCQNIYSSPDSFPFNYSGFPPSPLNSTGSTGSTSSCSPISTPMLTPDSCSDSEQLLCIPTHQLFEFQDTPSPSGMSSAPTSPETHRLSISINPSAASEKRSASPAPSTAKKARSSGERVSTKDFVPPDVTGLSKREARLVKNRAAAFLSRQRKREEFEAMEIRVAKLEQENNRLSHQPVRGSATIKADSAPDSAVILEVEKLRAKLVAAEKRERELSAKLAEKNAKEDALKIETAETQPSQPIVQPASRSNASLGLMALLCAIPTLLSTPTQSSVPASLNFTGSTLSPSSASDLNSFLPNGYGWSHNSGSNAVKDLDIDEQARIYAGTSTNSNTRKLEFVGGEPGLNNLEISFDTSPTEDGKIRVRIHPSSSCSSSATSPSSLPYPARLDSSSLSSWAAAFNSPYHGSFENSVSGCDPFLDVGPSNEFSRFASDGPIVFNQAGSSIDFSSLQPPGSGFDFGFENSNSNQRRVRIALKSLPTLAGEGGEWEVQFF